MIEKYVFDMLHWKSIWMYFQALSFSLTLILFRFAIVCQIAYEFVQLSIWL